MKFMGAKDKMDRRRQTGDRTRARLMEAARHLMAERGDEGGSLRAITHAAEANVAAVTYHFGGKDNLHSAVIEDAVSKVLDAQIANCQRVAPDASLSILARAYAQPIIAAVAAGSDESRALMRVTARVVSNPDGRYHEACRPILEHRTEEVLKSLRRALPQVSEQELRVRLQAVTGILIHLMSGAMSLDLVHMSEDQLTHILVPILTGALRAGDSQPSTASGNTAQRSTRPVSEPVTQ
jgi:AcrR family transcriptional regulator